MINAEEGGGGVVVVVGGGIAGLTAAHRLRTLDPGLEVVVLEASPRTGGKLRTGQLAGVDIETGAETFLTVEAGEDSAALRLAREVGLGDELVNPAPVPAALYVDGELRPIPGGTLMGIPADAHPDDRDLGSPLLAPGQDVAVGALVASRFGPDVVRRQVDPLLGGVYAGSADQLGLAATVPALHRTAQREHTLAGAVQAAISEARRATRAPAAQPFTTVRSGLSTLVDSLAAGSRVELNSTVRALTRTHAGFELTVGSTRDSHAVMADAVVLAVPYAAAARLWPDLGLELDYASMALVTLALPDGIGLPDLSGFLVPATEGLAVKAATFFTRKWPHLRRGPILVRASLGRYGDVATLQRTDADLIGTVERELGLILGVALPEPLDAMVTRWGGALPQYPPGHVDRVAAARAALPPGLALAGAAYDGVGIAACVRSGEAAARAVWEHLAQSPA